MSHHPTGGIPLVAVRLGLRAATNAAPISRDEVDAKMERAAALRESLLVEKTEKMSAEATHAKEVTTRQAEMHLQAIRDRKERLEAKLRAAEARHEAAISKIRSVAEKSNLHAQHVTMLHKRRFEPPSPPLRSAAASCAGAGSVVKPSAMPSATPELAEEDVLRSPPRARSRLTSSPDMSDMGVPLTRSFSTGDLSPQRRGSSFMGASSVAAHAHGLLLGPDDGFSLDGGSATAVPSSPGFGSGAGAGASEDPLAIPAIRRSHSAAHVAAMLWDSLHLADIARGESKGLDDSFDEETSPKGSAGVSDASVRAVHAPLGLGSPARRSPAAILADIEERQYRAAAARARHLADRAERARKDAQRVDAAAARASDAAEAQRARIDAALTSATVRRDAVMSARVQRAQARTELVKERHARITATRAVQRLFRAKHGASTAATEESSVSDPFDKVRRMFAGKKFSTALATLQHVLTDDAAAATTKEEEAATTATATEESSDAPTFERVRLAGEREPDEFELMARSIQAPEVLSAARTLIAGLKRTCEDVLLDTPLKLDLVDAVAPSEGKPPASPKHNARLATMAASGRTLLASFLIARYPEDMLPGYSSAAATTTTTTTASASEEESGAGVSVGAGAAASSVEEEGVGAGAGEEPAKAADTSDLGEEALVTAARAMVTALSLLCSAPKRTSEGGTATAVVGLARRFRAAWAEYQSAFVAWKLADGARLAVKMEPAMLDLHQTLRAIRRKNAVLAAEGHSPADVQLIAGVQQHLLLMRKQLTSMLGPEGAVAFEKAVEAKADAHDAEQIKKAEARAAARTDTDTAASSGTGASAGAGSATSPGRRTGTTGSPTRNATPATARHASGLAATRAALDNEVLVHRLCVDPNWRLPEVTADAALSWDVEVATPASASPTAAGAGAGTSGSASALPAVGTPERTADLFGDAKDMKASRARSRRRTPAYWATVLGRCESPMDTAAVVGSALSNIKDLLISLTPRRRDLASQVESSVSPDHVAMQIQRGVYTARSLATLVGWLGAHLLSLEAPARMETTRAWLDRARTAIPSEAASGSTAGTAGDAAPHAHTVARVLAWVFFKLDEVRNDLANFHLSTLAPYLTRGGKGAEYERRKFEASRHRGDVSLVGTSAWLRDTVAKVVERAREGALKDSTEATAALDKFTRNLHVDDPSTRRFLVTEGALQLLQRNTALTIDAAAGALAHAVSKRAGVTVNVGVRSKTVDEGADTSPEVVVGSGKPTADESNMHLPRSFPETMRLDAVVLEEAQNSLQRIALNSALVAMVKQVLQGRVRASAAAGTIGKEKAPAGRGVVGMGVATFDELHKHVDSWLASGTVRLDDVSAGLLNAARSLALKAGVVLTVEDEAQVTASVERVASKDHVLLSMFAKRAVGVLRSNVMASKSHEMHASSAAGDLASVLLPSRSPAVTAGLRWALPQLTELARTLTRVVVHNETVFGLYYRAMLRGLGAGMDDSAAASAAAKDAEEKAAREAAAAAEVRVPGTHRAAAGAGAAAAEEEEVTDGESDDEL